MTHTKSIKAITNSVFRAAKSHDRKRPWCAFDAVFHELVESIHEEPKMEPGQADTTPAVLTMDRPAVDIWQKRSDMFVAR